MGKSQWKKIHSFHECIYAEHYQKHLCHIKFDLSDTDTNIIQNHLTHEVCVHAHTYAIIYNLQQLIAKVQLHTC